MVKRPHRDPAKHSKKDPAKPTRAKAARPEAPPLDDALADLLNPAIGQGRAGIGAQTGTPSPLAGEGAVGGREGKSQASTSVQNSSTPARRLPTPTPSPSPTSMHSGARKRGPGGGGEERAGEKDRSSGLRPPSDNSFDRRADFANAHKARKSVTGAFGEAPQQSYVGKTPMPLGELDPDLAKALGIDEHEDDKNARGVIKYGDAPARSRFVRPAADAGGGAFGGLASQRSLDALLREGRPEFRADGGAT